MIERLKKPYEGHEIAYRRMRRQGIRSWGERVPVNGVCEHRELDDGDLRFLTDTLAESWAPSKGRVIEFGCGTAPLLRWVCRKGFTGMGVDISKTALAMARAQSRKYDAIFKCADLCKKTISGVGKFDLGIDGHCLHCIISDADRKAFLDHAFHLLSNEGLFLVMTMCGPVNRERFSDLTSGQRVVDGIIYSPYEKAEMFEGVRHFEGRPYMPTRRVLFWRTIVREVQDAGFHVQTIRFNHFAEKDPCSSLYLAAIKGR